MLSHVSSLTYCTHYHDMSHQLSLTSLLSVYRTAFVTWLISNVLVCFVVFRGLVFLSLTGCLMSTATLVYHCMQYAAPIIIPFEDGVLRLHYGWCFWLCLSTGKYQIYTTNILYIINHGSLWP